jgi:hypothetical protein
LRLGSVRAGALAPLVVLPNDARVWLLRFVHSQADRVRTAVRRVAGPRA